MLGVKSKNIVCCGARSESFKYLSINNFTKIKLRNAGRALRSFLSTVYEGAYILAAATLVELALKAAAFSVMNHAYRLSRYAVVRAVDTQIVIYLIQLNTT